MPVLVRVAVPGAIGGFLGAVVLTNISLASAKGWMSGLLIFFGLVIFARFGLGSASSRLHKAGTRPAGWLRSAWSVGSSTPRAAVAGGPVVTPSLMTVTRHEPRKVVGTTNAAEFVVAVSVSTGFLTGTAQHGIPWIPVLGLVLGGVLVAPFAARLAGRLPHALMGTLVGALIVLVNAVTVVDSMGGIPWWLDVLGIAFIVVVSGAVAYRAWRRERLATRAGKEEPAMVPRDEGLPS
jgi:uncharacterized membrane protein YfcA